MIKVANVTKRHGAITSVDDVSFTAKPGAVTGLLGPNGAGKSSVMRIICDLDHADAGTATVWAALSGSSLADASRRGTI